MFYHTSVKRAGTALPDDSPTHYDSCENNPKVKLLAPLHIRQQTNKHMLTTGVHWSSRPQTKDRMLT